MTTDVVVVGAGPSGSVAALTLARAGARVLLVEKSGLPREKACGDALVPRAVSKLRRLGVPLEDAHAIEGIRVRSAEDWSLAAELYYPDDAGAMLPRSILDERLALLAASSGAVLLTKTEASELLVDRGVVRGVRLRTRGGAPDTVRAPVTILAGGAASALTRQAPVRPKQSQEAGFAIRSYLEGVRWDGPGTFEVYFPIEIDGRPVAGYGWVFPLGSDGANIGVGHFSLDPQRAQLRTLHSAFVNQVRQRDPRFASARPAGPLLGGLVRTGGLGPSAYGPGVLLVGDAAGLVNPFTAEGISTALESGELAARACLDHLADGTSLSSYGDTIRGLGRLASALPVLYRAFLHVSRDAISFLSARKPLGKAAVFAFTSDQYERCQPLEARSHADRARARALRLAARERVPFHRLVAELSKLEEARAPVAEAFFAAAGNRISREHRDAAVFLEMFRIACCLLDELDGVGPGGPRGPGWLSCRLGISIADRLLARCFRATSRLSPNRARAIAEAFVEVLDELAVETAAGTPASPARRRSILVAAAAGAGMRFG